MLPLVFATSYVNYPNLNLSQIYQVPTTYYSMIPMKQTCDQACQFPETSCTEEVYQNCDSNSDSNSKYVIIEQELLTLLRYLSKNISLLKEKNFENFVNENLKNLISFNKELPNILKKRYIQVNKTKEEMTKFIIRRCFQFIKTQINYQDQENLGAEERDRLFYHTFFSNDKEFLEKFKEESIEDMIPFRKDSKLKTINDAYLKKLFESQKFSQYYSDFLCHFKEICQHENEEKLDKMTKQIIKLIFARDYGKLKSYRRFPWKDHEFAKCESRAKELFQKYHSLSKIKSKLSKKLEFKPQDLSLQEQFDLSESIL